MASALSTATPTLPRSASGADPAAATIAGRRDRLPVHWDRWATRLGYALPLVVLNVVIAGRGFVGPADAELLRRARNIHWGSPNLSFVAEVYPPLPSALARLFPSITALAIFGALAGGAVLEAVHRRVRAAGVGRAPTLLLVALLAGTPWFAFTAAADLAAMLTVMFLAIALDGFARFVLRAETEGGFRAGLALGLAALCHPAAIIAAVAFALAAPMIARRRFRGRRGAVRATAAVLLFPTVAGLLGWTFLCWRFAGSPLAWLHTGAPRFFHPGSLADMAERVRTGVLVPLAVTPLFAVTVFLAARRHPLGGAGRLLPVVALAAAAALGVGLPDGAAAVMLGVCALGSLIRPIRRPALVLLLGVGLLGLVLRWTLSGSSTFLLWEQALSR